MFITCTYRERDADRRRAMKKMMQNIYMKWKRAWYDRTRKCKNIQVRSPNAYERKRKYFIRLRVITITSLHESLRIYEFQLAAWNSAGFKTTEWKSSNTKLLHFFCSFKFCLRSYYFCGVIKKSQRTTSRKSGTLLNERRRVKKYVELIFEHFEERMN